MAVNVKHAAIHVKPLQAALSIFRCSFPFPLQVGGTRIEYLFYLFILFAASYPLLRYLWTTDNVQNAAIWIWIIGTVSIYAATKTHVLIFWIPLGLLIFLTISVLGLPFSLSTSSKLAVTGVVLVQGIASAYLGFRYSRWLSDKVLPRYVATNMPIFLNQSFNVVTAFLVRAIIAVACLGLSGLVLLIVLAAIVLLSNWPLRVPWLGPALGMLAVLSILLALGRSRRSLVLGGLIFLTAGILAYAFSHWIVGPFSADAWEMIWYTVFVPVCATALALTPKMLGQQPQQ